MKRRLLHILPLIALAVSCTNKDLCYDDHSLGNGANMNVVIHWEDGVSKPVRGMMINLFPLAGSPLYGMEHLPADGGPINLRTGASYFSLCYDYYADNIYFRGEYDPATIEAYSSPLVRSTYSKAYPDEVTVSEPSFPFYVDRVVNFPVNGSDLHFYVRNVVEVFTFEIRNVEGAEYISACRGGVGGMSGSYFLSDGTLSQVPSTVLFDAGKDAAGKKITGSFRTFGRLNRLNRLTIEILYPSAGDGIIHASWDVTDQVINAPHIPGIPDIIIDNNGEIPPIIPDDDELGSGFSADVEEWDNIYVPMPM